MRIALLAPLLLAACVSSDVSRDVGARCDLNSDCDGRCLGPSGDFPGGFCTLDCDSDTDCPNNAHCISDNGGVCVFACGSDSDCTFLGAYTCQASDSQGAGARVNVCRGG
jgi:hypothetical protein